MNCYNSSEFLTIAIESVLDQTYTNWEIVFWDNVSTDASSQIVKNYNDPRIRYFRGEKLVPLGHARNLAIAECKGELIGFLDCDDVWMPTKLEKQVPLFADRSVDIVFSDTFFFNNEGVHKRLYKSKKLYTGYCFSELLKRYFLSLETVVIRRAALDRLTHWFDERFSAIEEADLFRRIAYSGKLAFVNEVLAKWRIHSGSYTWNRIKDFSLETEQMLETYETLFEGFAEKNKSEIVHLRARLLVGEAKYYWQNNRANEARQLIRGYRHPKTLLICMMYAISFFPGKYFNMIKG
jgi:glycosyltransferase involved in cell wall biosynthesis